MIFFVNDNNESISYEGEFLLTKQAVSFFSFRIKGDVSINFNIPNTSDNRRILGYHGFNQNNNPAFSELPFNVTSNGNVLARGYIVITSDNGSELECFFISGNTWINQLTQSLKSFDYDEYTVYPGDYIAVNTEEVDSTTIGKRSGIIFPLIDWCYEGQKFANDYGPGYDSKFKSIVYLDEWSAKDYFPEMLPVVFLHTVVEQIAKKSNIKLAGDIFNETVYNRIVITPETADLQWPDYFVNDSQIRASTLVTTAVTGGVWTKMPFENLTYPNGTGLWDSANSRYTAKYTGIYRTSTFIDASISVNFNFRIYINGSYVSAKQYSKLVGNQGTSEGYVYLAKGDYLEVYIYDTNNFNILSGTNLEVKLMKSLFYDDEFYLFSDGPYIPINAIVPDIKAIDLLKFVINYFGCVAYFDQYTQTLTINKTSSIIQYEDWSDYVKSYEIDYNNDVCENNYIKFKDVDDAVIKSYNEISPIGYGNGNIEANRIKSERIVTQLPFGATADILNNNWNAQLASVNLIKLSPKNSFEFTSVTSASGKAGLNGTFEGFSNSVDQLVYVKGNIYNGYYYITGATSSLITLDATFIDDDSGSVSSVQKDLVNSESRILLVGYYGITSFSDLGYIYSPDNTVISNINYCWFYRQNRGKSLDTYDRNSLAINDLTNSNFDNRTISEAYYNKLISAYQAPGLKTLMLLNDKKFQEFDFSKLIYLNTGSINGYFFVELINNYKDSVTPVQVNLVASSYKDEKFDVIYPFVPDADYIVFQYTLGLGAGTDLDTLTTLISPVNDGPIGYCGSGDYDSPGIYGGPYLYWGGDNTSSSGSETIFVSVAALKIDYPTISDVSINCRANWWTSKGTGEIFITMFAYKGGTMESDDAFGFINVGGELLGSKVFPSVTIDVVNNSCSLTDCVGLFNYNISTGIFTQSNCITSFNLSLDPGSYIITGYPATITKTVTLNLQLKAQYNSGSSAKIFYKINSGSWNLIGSYVLTTSYSSQSHTVTVNDGDVIYYAVQNSSDQNVSFGTGNGGSYFGKCGKAGPYSTSVVDGMTTYLNVAALAGGYTTC